MTDSKSFDADGIEISAKPLDLGVIKVETDGPDWSPAMDDLNDSKFHADGEVMIGFTKFGVKFRFSISNVEFDKRTTPPKKYNKAFHGKDKDGKPGIQIDKKKTGPDSEKFTIRVSLSEDLDWKFDFEQKKGDTALAPMRFHYEDHSAYYKILKDTDTSFILEATQSGYDGDADEKFRRHSFNLYVLIEQVVGKPLPVRFDPDVDNPPRLGE